VAIEGSAQLMIGFWAEVENEGIVLPTSPKMRRLILDIPAMLILRLQNRRQSKKLGVLEDVVYS
jgi:hypothetical protein